MDPNNNQPINTNPFGQQVTPEPVVNPTPMPESAVQQPTPAVPPPAPTVTAAPVTAPVPETPKNGSKKGIILLIILLLLILGLGTYVFFVKNQLSTAKKTSTQNTSTAIPTIVPTATPATIEEINVASPDADLKTIETDVQGL